MITGHFLAVKENPNTWLTCLAMATILKMTWLVPSSHICLFHCFCVYVVGCRSGDLCLGFNIHFQHEVQVFIH